MTDLHNFSCTLIHFSCIHKAQFGQIMETLYTLYTYLSFLVVSGDLCTTIDRGVVILTLRIGHAHWRGLVLQSTAYGEERYRERERKKSQIKNITLTLLVGSDWLQQSLN